MLPPWAPQPGRAAPAAATPSGQPAAQDASGQPL